MRRWHFIWAVPILWVAVSMTAFHFPGDEYGLWAVGSAAGMWGLTLIENSGDIHDLKFRLAVALSGMLTLAAIGALMDWLRVRRLTFWFTLPLCAVAILLMSISSYPSVERALAKNGSWTAYVLFSINMGLYLAIITCTAGTAIANGIRSAIGSPSQESTRTGIDAETP